MLIVLLALIFFASELTAGELTPPELNLSLSPTEIELAGDRDLDVAKTDDPIAAECRPRSASIETPSRRPGAGDVTKNFNELLALSTLPARCWSVAGHDR